MQKLVLIHHSDSDLHVGSLARLLDSLLNLKHNENSGYVVLELVVLGLEPSRIKTRKTHNTFTFLNSVLFLVLFLCCMYRWAVRPPITRTALPSDRSITCRVSWSWYFRNRR